MHYRLAASSSLNPKKPNDRNFESSSSIALLIENDAIVAKKVLMKLIDKVGSASKSLCDLIDSTQSSTATHDHQRWMLNVGNFDGMRSS